MNNCIIFEKNIINENILDRRDRAGQVGAKGGGVHRNPYYSTTYNYWTDQYLIYNNIN